MLSGNTRNTTPSFEHCSADGCDVTSATGEYGSMMLRIGFSKCNEHLRHDPIEVFSRIDHRTHRLDVNMITVIFYSIGLSQDGQVEQLSAFSTTNHNFSSIIKTSLRANTSSILSNLPSDVYNFVSEKPRDALERFVDWTIMTHATNTGNTDPENIVLTAHLGSCHDHVYLLRTMIASGIRPLDFRLADSLALLKTMQGPTEPSEIASLVAKYAEWLSYTADGADSDARALRAVVMAAFTNVGAACYAFSISCRRFMVRTGLNMMEVGNLTHIHHGPMSERAIICGESGKIIGYKAHSAQR